MKKNKAGSAVPVLEYPEIDLWKRKSSPEDSLQIINKEDFPFDQIMENLGLECRRSLAGSFGIRDITEIVRRQELMKLIMYERKLCEFLIKEKNLATDFPQDHNSFIQYHNPDRVHNPFWTRIHELLEMLDRMPVRDAELVKLRTFLKSSLKFEEIERVMARRIIEKMDAMAVIEGSITFKLGKALNTDKVIRKQVYGYRIYSLSLSNAGKQPYPAWTKQAGCMKTIKITRIGEIYTDWRNDQELATALKGREITDLSEEMIRDISDATNLLLQNWDDNRIKDTELGREIRNRFNGGIVSVSFAYSIEGLKLHIYNLEPTPEIRSFSYEYPVCIPRREGKKIITMRARIATKTEQFIRQMNAGAVAYFLKDGNIEFFDKEHRVSSSRFDEEHKHFALPNIFKDPEIKPIADALLKLRRFCADQFEILGQLAELVSNCKALADRIGSPITFPEILPDSQNIVAFEELFPVHLALQNRGADSGKIVPIRRLPPVNGSMLALTGAHGGGKTVTELTLAINLWLAQSGLPVFGKGFKFNIKDTIGLVFINRGEGSTCEQLVTKIMEILVVLKVSDHKKILVIIDELGTGTQEESGLELGRDLLKKLHAEHTSVLFSTQITLLAQFAVDNLGAQSFMFAPDHSILPGIGKGGMEDLRSRLGVDKLLLVEN
ncbi:MAG: hypothetical protein PHU42_00445 [Patescibacteria group bacterium]|nr:hypothetical protein [Patescibacteria group bacterium]